MFKNDFQGGNYFEIFNPSVKEPLLNFKVIGSHGIQKIYDKDIKSSVYQLEGIPTTTKITLPKDSRQGLSLVQRIIVLQLFIKHNSEFSVEIGITDLSRNRRNLLFSTSHKELNVQPLSARIPIKYVNRAQWTNLVFDLSSLVNEIWKNQTFKTIDLLSVGANCKLRKAFTVKNFPSADLDTNNLVFDDLLNAVNFPEGSDYKIQVFNTNDSSPSESLESSGNLTQLDFSASNNHKSTSKPTANVFNIAFGTKINKNFHPPNSANQLNQSQRKTSLNNTSNSSQQSQNGDQLVNNLNNSIKNSQIAPLTMSSNSIQNLTNRQKSVSDFRLTDKSNLPDNPKTTSSNSANNLAQIELAQENKPGIAKTTWIQQGSAKSTTNLVSRKLPYDANNSNPKTSNKSGSAKLESPRQRPQTTKTSETESNTNTNYKLNEVLTTQAKIPYPPPQSTRPLSSRKILRSPAKTINSTSNQTLKTDNPASLKSSNFTKNISEDTNNLEDSINDIIQDLKSNTNTKPTYISSSSENSINKANSNSSNAVNVNEITNLDDSSRTIVYTFSSKPKPVTSAKDSNNTSINTNNFISSSGTSNSKADYDPRKYGSFSVSAVNTKTSIPAPSTFIPTPTTSNSKQIAPFFDVSNYSMIYDSLNPLSNNGVMDSFEAKMLQEMKAEMDEHTNKNTANNIKNGSGTQTSKQSSTSSTNKTNVSKKSVSASNTSKLVTNTSSESAFKPTSPDVEYLEEAQLQREPSGLQSPLSDRTTSEKYNFDAMTSSIEDTTTSLSKKTVDRKGKLDDANYQEEMNMSMLSNLPAKSINLKDLPSKYSPLLNQQHPSSAKISKSPITEEPSQYDDSQADIDEIISDSDEEVDLLFDAALNCYYDPKTGTYYELNLS